MKLQGKNALITGAAIRLGREIALTLAERGADIVIHYRRSHREALRLKRDIELLGRKAYLIRTDLSPRGKGMVPVIRRFVKAVTSRVPRIDVLVNNAAVFYPTPFGRITESQWDDVLAVNLKAPFFLAQEMGLRMARQKSGKIVNLVDGSAFRPATNYLPYAVSKAGLIAATTGLAKNLAPHVQVVSIAPGPVLPLRGMSERAKKGVLQKTLLKRWGHPRDIAQTVRFFIEDTDFITGALIPVDGGASIV